MLLRTLRAPIPRPMHASANYIGVMPSPISTYSLVPSKFANYLV